MASNNVVSISGVALPADQGQEIQAVSTTSADEKRKRRAETLAQAREVLAFLNEKTERNFREVDVNLGFIVARIESGITPDELRQIVAMKCREWKQNPRMRKYLRPMTLFNRTRCEQYYGELQ